VLLSDFVARTGRPAGSFAALLASYTVGVSLLVRLAVAWAINAAALWLANTLWDGVSIHGWGAYLIGAAVLGVANAILKPLLTLLTLPLIIVTLGFFYLVINIAMVALAEWIAPNFSIDGFWSYVGTVVVVWAVNWVADQVFEGPRRRPRTRVA
jgi:putative membrane protein